MQNASVRFQRSHNLRFVLSVLLALGSLVFGCSSEKKPITEAAPPTPVAPSEQPQQMTKLPPPQMNKVQEAVQRVFKDAVVIDNSHAPAFIVADFNGDASQDVAVVLTPAPNKLNELNQEFPAWILRDPFGAVEPRGPRLRIADKEVLLAVIHGYGANGWLDPQATQTFLLKNAVGAGMEARPRDDFLLVNKGKKLPTVSGDLISETRGTEAGYLYYSGANYSWYDPKTFSGEPGPRRGHGEQRMKTEFKP